MIASGFKHGYELTMAVRQVVSGGPAEIAVAYWGSNACDRLALPTNMAGYRIACDAFSGFCSPVAIKEMLRRGAQIVDAPNLHAKVYRSAIGLIVGSANASSRGLSLEEHDSFGLECGVYDNDTARTDAAGQWFDDLFNASTELGPQHISEIGQCWRRRRASEPLRTTLMAAILANAAALEGRRLRAYIYSAAEPSPAVQARYKKSGYFDANRWENSTSYPFFWDEMPASVAVGDELLCFEVGKKGASFEGAWKILARLGSDGDTIWPSAPVEVPFVHQIGSAAEVIRRLNDAIKSGRLQVDAEPMTLVELARSLAGDSQMDDHLARIAGRDARAAYRALVDEADALGLAASYKTGLVPAVKWQDVQENYLFSFIPNRDDILFYVRKPALKAYPQLGSGASSLGLDTRTNPAGEQTIRIRTRADASKLVDWLRVGLGA